MSHVVHGRRPSVERAPDLVDALLLTLLEASDALTGGSVARLAAAESRRRYLLRLLSPDAATSGRPNL